MNFEWLKWKLKILIYIVFLLKINIELTGQTDDREKYMYNLPTSTYQYSDTSSLEIILDANHFSVLPGTYELGSIWAVVEARSVIAKVLNPLGISAADITTPTYYKDDYGSYYNDSIIIRARTKTPDGTVIEMDPSEYLKLPQLISRLEQHFKYIVLDLPSLERSFKSAIKISGLADGAILVIEAERVRWEVAERTAAQLLKAEAKILGVVLNKRKYYIPKFIYKTL